MVITKSFEVTSLELLSWWPQHSPLEIADCVSDTPRRRVAMPLTAVGTVLKICTDVCDIDSKVNVTDGGGSAGERFTPVSPEEWLSLYRSEGECQDPYRDGGVRSKRWGPVPGWGLGGVLGTKPKSTGQGLGFPGAKPAISAGTGAQ